MSPELMGAIGFALGLLTQFIAFMVWWSNSTKKRYAAERDFQHLKKNYEQLSSNISTLAKDADDRFDHLDLEFKEVKGLLHALTVASARSDQSQGWNRPHG